MWAPAKWRNCLSPKSRAVNSFHEAARTLALRSVAARRRKWGEEEFREKMRAWGKLGGRPKKERGNAE